MDYEVKRGNTTVLTVRPSEGSKLSVAVMGGNVVTFDFALPEPADIAIGDYITVYRNKYILNTTPVIRKEDSSGVLKYEYSCIFEAEAYDLAKIRYLMLDAENNFTTSDFSITGTADVFIDLLIRNANRDYSGWIKGRVDLTETKTLTFTGQNILSVLATLAIEFNTEWWIDGREINLTKKGKVSGLEFAYGKGNGLYSITRTPLDSTNLVTRLFVEGGTKNLLPSYRNYRRRVQLPAATGYYLEKNVQDNRPVEYSLTFDEIYPERTGTVSSVTDIYTFTDVDLDFNLNDYFLPGLTPLVVFKTGPLAGYEFEIHSFDNLTKTFVINHNKDEKSLEIPSQRIHAMPGDKYTLVNINMPETYILAAENRVQDAGQEYLDKNSIPRVMYSVEPDPLYFIRNGIELVIGDTAGVYDVPLDVNITPRIMAYEQSLQNKHIYFRMDLSEHVNINAIVRQNAEQQKVNQAVLSSDIVKPNAGVVPVKIPFRREIEFSAQATPIIPAKGSAPVFWKDNNQVFLSGAFSPLRATHPFMPFTLPLGYRPWFAEEERHPVKVYVGITNTLQLWGTLTVKRNGEVIITAYFADGTEVAPNIISWVDLSGVSFYSELGEG